MAGCHAEPAKGRVNGKPGISLETYVQLEYFDRIIRYANLRLLHMSRGQYELKRRQLPEQGTKGEVGPDLDVIDHYNGSVREVATLSGGESFLASLSLALGMSGLVQASAASAVRLDTMFVDEGFGSLSGSFLELAMNEWIDTAENGHRLIGIIFHVRKSREGYPIASRLRKSERAAASQKSDNPIEAGRTVGERKYFSKTYFPEKQRTQSWHEEDSLCRDCVLKLFAVQIGRMDADDFAMSFRTNSITFRLPSEEGRVLSVQVQSAR